MLERSAVCCDTPQCQVTNTALFRARHGAHALYAVPRRIYARYAMADAALSSFFRAAGFRLMITLRCHFEASR